MKLLKRRLIYFIVLAVIGLFFMCYSCIDIIENAISVSLGLGLFIVSFVNIIVLLRLQKESPHVIEDYLELRADERTQYINEKSYSFSFWVSIFVDFILSATLPFFGLDGFALIVGASLLLKIIVYFISHHYFNSKY